MATKYINSITYGSDEYKIVDSSSGYTTPELFVVTATITSVDGDGAPTGGITDKSAEEIYNATSNGLLPVIVISLPIGTHTYKMVAPLAVAGSLSNGSSYYAEFVYENQYVELGINYCTLTVNGSVFTMSYMNGYVEKDSCEILVTSPINMSGSGEITNNKTISLSLGAIGNIQNDGTLQSTDVTIATGDKLVVTDNSNSSKVARTSIGFDTTDTTKYLRHDGTWQTINAGGGTVTSVGVTNGGGLTVSGSPVTTSGNITVGHSNSVTTQSTQGVYPITIDANGHIASYGTKEDLYKIFSFNSSDAAQKQIIGTGSYGCFYSDPSIAASIAELNSMYDTKKCAVQFISSEQLLECTIMAIATGKRLTIDFGGEIGTASNVMVFSFAGNYADWTSVIGISWTYGANLIGSIYVIPSLSAIIIKSVTFDPGSYISKNSINSWPQYEWNASAGPVYVTPDLDNPVVTLVHNTPTSTFTSTSTSAIYPVTIDGGGHISSYGSAITLDSNDTAKYLRHDGSWAAVSGGGGSVTSVGLSNATDGGLTISGSPITSSGSITVGHSNVLSNAQTTQAVYPITIDKNGHIDSFGAAVTISDTKVTNTLATTTKYYITGTTTATTNTGTQSFDTGIYATTTAGQLNATTYKVNEQVTLQWNSTDSSLDFIF